MNKLLVISLLSFQILAQDFASIGLASQEESQKDVNTRIEINQSGVIDKAAPKECSSDDQRSLPQRDILALMIDKNSSFNINSKGGGDYLTVDASSKIIGNCSSMLKPEVSFSNAHGKYIYEVKVRKTCDDSSCPYEVSSIVDGKKKVETKNYPSNLEGFYLCMQDNVGIIDNDGRKSWNKSKIVKKELNPTSVVAPVTSEVLFVSKGPLAMQKSKNKNLIKNNSCDFYEKINGESVVHFSKEDLEYRSMEKQAQALCRSSKYSDVQNGLSAFAGYDELYNQLIDVRNKLLLDEIKAQRQILAGLVADKELKNANSKKLNQLMNDYFDLVIDKNLSFKNHTEADKNNPNLLVNLKAKYDEAYRNGDQENIEKYKKAIQEKANELSKFLVDPYFSAKDYLAMVDIGNKPNMLDSNWKNATQKLHMSLMTLKLVCEAYGTNETCQQEKPTNKNFKEKSTLVSLSDIAKRAKKWNKKVGDDYDDKVTLIKKPNGYKSLKYKKLLHDCELNEQYANHYSQGIQTESQGIQNYCQNQSYGDQQKFQYCVNRFNSQIKSDANTLVSKNDNCKNMKKHYTSQMKKWENLESDRDIYLGLSEEKRKANKAKVAKIYAKDTYRPNFQYKGINQQAAQNFQSSGNFNFGSNINRQPSMSTNGYFNQNQSFGNQFYNPQSNFNYNNQFMVNYGNQGMNNYYGNNTFGNNPLSNILNGGLNFGLNMGAGQGYNPNQYMFGNNFNMVGPGASYNTGSPMYNGPAGNNPAGGFRFNLN